MKKKSSRLFSLLWPSLAIVTVCVVFFWKFFIKGLIPFPGDFVVGVYYPWLDYKWGYPAGVPVKNPIMADVPSFIYPMQTLGIDQIKSGQAPLWNPLILGGVPLLANFQSAPFSPTNIVNFVFERKTAWGIQIVLQHFFAALFSYFLLRYWKVSKLASILGGIIYAFSGYNLIWSQWNGHTLTASFIPLTLLFVDKWMKESWWYWGLSISVAILLVFISGYPQTVIYLALAIFLLWFMRIKNLRMRERPAILTKTILLGVFLVLGMGLASLQILPGWDLLKSSQRVVELHPFEWAFLPWSKIITFLAPDYFGNHATGNWWGPQDYTSNTGFVGVVALSLAVISTTLIKKRREVLFAVVLSLVALTLAFPTPLSIFLWKSGVFGLNAASAHRSLVLFNLGIATLAAFGFDSLRKQSKMLTLTFPLVILSGFGLYAFRIQQVIALRNLVLPFGVFLATAFVFLVIPKFKRVLLLISVIELFYFGWKYTPFSPKEFIFPETPVITFLKNQEKSYRVVADKVVPINFLMNYGIQTLEGYDAVYPKNVAEYIAKINGSFGSENSIRRYGIIDNYESPLLDAANVKYLVVKSEDTERYVKNSKFKEVFRDKSVVVLENKNAYRATFMNSEEIYKSTSQAFYTGLKISAISLLVLGAVAAILKRRQV